MAVVRLKGGTQEDQCATRLKNLCYAAIYQLEAERARTDVGRAKGAVLEYTKLPEAVTEWLYPEHFGMGRQLLQDHMPQLLGAARWKLPSPTLASCFPP